MKKLLLLLSLFLSTINILAQNCHLPSTLDIIKTQCNAYSSNLSYLIIKYNDNDIAKEYLFNPNRNDDFDVVKQINKVHFGIKDTISCGIKKYINNNKDILNTMIKSIDENLYTQIGFVYLSIKNRIDTCISISEILYKSTFNYPKISRNERVKDVLISSIIPNIIKMGENAKDINVKYIGLSASYRCADFSQKSAIRTEFAENIMVIANVDDIVKVVNLDMTENQFIQKLDIYLSSKNEKIIKIDLD